MFLKNIFGFNELLWFIFLITDLSFCLLLFRFFGKNGLYSLIAANIILCNIQVTKLVKLFGVTVTLGNILYGSIFLATDILSEYYGKDEAKKAVYSGFLILIFMTFTFQITLLYKPDPADLVHNSMKNIFSFIPRIAIGSLIAYLVSQIHDVWAFHFWKNLTKGKKLWIRNNFSTMVSQAIDSFIFCFIAFYGIYEKGVFIQILLSTYLIKFLVALFDTPFIYLSKIISRKVNDIMIQKESI
ncbi:MAG: queuosine precursor transporter [Spirochaetes bacterium]|nr:queuosine precursor transporter [Spirochaetota bacterium]